MSTLFVGRCVLFGKKHVGLVAKIFVNVTAVATLGFISLACNTNLFSAKSPKPIMTDQQQIDELTLHSRAVMPSKNAIQGPSTTSDYYFRGKITKVLDPADHGEKSDFIYILCEEGEMQHLRKKKATDELWVKAVRANIDKDRLKVGYFVEATQSKQLNPDLAHFDTPFFYAPKQVQIAVR